MLERLRERFFAGVPRFTYLDTIGRGGMGVVFKAHDVDLDEVVALKVLAPRLESEDPEMLARFKREISLNRRIKHPNVARIHDFGMSGNFPYISMEYVQGKDLRHLIEDEGPMGLDPARVISILRQICLGTHAAHALGIIHRDLKSPNVVVDDTGAVAILDFGLARATGGSEITMHSTVLGTPQYMSPEQALGREVDGRSDLYSIGVVAFEALTGTLPFGGESAIAIALKQVHEPVPDLLDIFPGIDPRLRDFVVKAMEKDPARRWQTAAEMEGALADLQQSNAAAAWDGTAPGAVRKAPPAPPANISFTPRPVSELSPRQPLSSSHGTRSSTVPVVVRPVKQPPRPKPVVYLVENPGPERRQIAELLVREGFVPRAAASGPEALEALVDGGVDIILMAIDLPGMDGFDTTRILRSQSALSAVPVILIAPKLDRSAYAFGIQSGAADVIARPFHPQGLVELFKKLLRPAGYFPAEPGAAVASDLPPDLYLDESTTSRRRK